MTTVGQLQEIEVGSFRVTKSGIKIYNRLLFLWILVLFEPARLVSYYVPVLGPLKWIPELMLYWLTFLWFVASVKKHGYPLFTAFFSLTLFGTFIAFFEGNWGVAREIDRLIILYFFLGFITYSFINQHDRRK